MSRELSADLNTLSKRIIGASIEVHRNLGPGLLESTYEACLSRELALTGLSFERQVALPVEYKGVHLDCGYRLDLVVEDRVIVEIKAVEALLPVHDAQLITYLRLTAKPLGLLINFNVPTLIQGIRRRANTFQNASTPSASRQ